MTNSEPETNQTDDQTAALLDQLRAKNHALAVALDRAGKELGGLRTQLAHLGQPPLSTGTFVQLDTYTSDEQGVRLASAQVIHRSHRLIVSVSPSVDVRRLQAGDTVLLNEALLLVGTREELGTGAIRHISQLLDSARLLVADASGQVSLVRRGAQLADAELSPGQRVRLDGQGLYAVEVIADAETDDLLLEETPDISYEDIGGLDQQLEIVHDAVELPFLHRDLFARYGLAAPKGLLLYGPPGNGKTLIAKAVAHSLINSGLTGFTGGVFLSVKGPEILNKYVGESERLIRSLFQRARSHASAGVPVVVFIDEMDSLLRTRGSGISSDVENTIVAQFLAELDGIESLDNVIIIGASNRVDMIDPAVLRPGRLDVKIRVGRPGPVAAAAILRHYVTEDLPLAAGLQAEDLVAAAVESVFATSPDRLVAQVQTEDGQWQSLYLSDLISGASLKNIADRAKTKAVKAAVEAMTLTGRVEKGETQQADQADGRRQPEPVPGLSLADMLAAVDDEFADILASVSGLSTSQWSGVQDLTLGPLLAVRPVQARVDPAPVTTSVAAAASAGQASFGSDSDPDRTGTSADSASTTAAQPRSTTEDSGRERSL